MSKAVDASCFSSPCSIERNAKSVSVVTVIALVALAAVAIGVLAILANLPHPPQGLGIMSEIGMKGGIAMSAAGGALFIGTLIVASRLKSRESQKADVEVIRPNRAENRTVQQKEWHEPEINYLSFELNNQWILLYKQTTWEAFEKANLQSKLEERQKNEPEATLDSLSPQTKRNARTKAQDDAARPLVEKLQMIYPYIHSLPTIYNPHHNVNGELEKQFELILLNKPAILDLKLADIENYDIYQMHILIQRVQMIQEDEVELEKEPLGTPTIRSLLSLSNPEKILEMIEGRSNLASLLAPRQLFILFKNPLPSTGILGGLLKRDLFSDANWIARLLPVKTKAEKEHTRRKLAELNTHQATASRLYQLPLTHVLLLPDAYFNSSNWQWTPESFQMIMNLYKLESEEVTRIVQTLTIETIRALDEQLTAEHFPLFSDQQLRDVKGFPWVAFSQKERWGPIAREKIELRQKETRAVEKGRIAINPIRLPWDSMKLDALKEFFKPEPEGQTQKQRFAELNSHQIQTLQGVWGLEHLKFFTDEQRCDPNFPWGRFIKAGIGQELRQIYQNRPDRLAEISLPWEQLYAIAIGTLFSVATVEEQEQTKKLLAPFKIEIIKKITHGLVVGHLYQLGENILKNVDFRWTPFLTQKGIGRFFYINNKMILEIQDRIAWDLLPVEEVDASFPTISQTFESQLFFQSLTVTTLTKLAPKLKAWYICYCNQRGTYKQTGDPSFPWKEFLTKDEIGISIRYAYERIGLNNIPWDLNLISEKEMAAMLAHNTGRDGICTIETFLQALPSYAIATIERHIPVADVALFSTKQLTDPAFPWSSFICKPGIGAVLSELLIKYPQVAASIPWSAFESSEEFKTALSGKQGSTEKKQQIMKAIPKDQFEDLATRFGKDTFKEIVNNAQYDYQRTLRSWFTDEQQGYLKNLGV